MIEPLPIAFRKAERIYRQLARDRFVALYEVRNAAHVLIGFELIIVRLQKAAIVKREQKEVSFPARERYPLASEFGKFAWSLPTGTRNLAELLFDQLATNQPKLPKTVSPEILMRFGYPSSGPSVNRSGVRDFLTGRPLRKTTPWWHSSRSPIKISAEQPVHPAEFDHLPDENATKQPQPNALRGENEN